MCAAMSEPEEGDTYIDDRLTYELTVIKKTIIADPDHKTNGLWHWRDAYEAIEIILHIHYVLGDMTAQEALDEICHLVYPDSRPLESTTNTPKGDRKGSEDEDTDDIRGVSFSSAKTPGRDVRGSTGTTNLEEKA